MYLSPYFYFSLWINYWLGKNQNKQLSFYALSPLLTSHHPVRTVHVFRWSRQDQTSNLDNTTTITPQPDALLHLPNVSIWKVWLPAGTPDRIGCHSSFLWRHNFRILCSFWKPDKAIAESEQTQEPLIELCRPLSISGVCTCCHFACKHAADGDPEPTLNPDIPQITPHLGRCVFPFVTP